jgi:hypothetical protein
MIFVGGQLCTSQTSGAAFVHTGQNSTAASLALLLNTTVAH